MLSPASLAASSPLERSASLETSVTVSAYSHLGAPSPSAAAAAALLVPTAKAGFRSQLPGGFSHYTKDGVPRGRALEGASYYCAFPNCRRRYSNADHVRKHCRKKHNQWLKEVDAQLRQQGKRDASSYCVIVPEG